MNAIEAAADYVVVGSATTSMTGIIFIHIHKYVCSTSIYIHTYTCAYLHSSVADVTESSSMLYRVMLKILFMLFLVQLVLLLLLLHSDATLQKIYTIQ